MFYLRRPIRWLNKLKSPIEQRMFLKRELKFWNVKKNIWGTVAFYFLIQVNILGVWTYLMQTNMLGVSYRWLMSEDHLNMRSWYCVSKQRTWGWGDGFLGTSCCNTWDSNGTCKQLSWLWSERQYCYLSEIDKQKESKNSLDVSCTFPSFSLHSGSSFRFVRWNNEEVNHWIEGSWRLSSPKHTS